MLSYRKVLSEIPQSSVVLGSIFHLRIPELVFGAVPMRRCKSRKKGRDIIRLGVSISSCSRKETSFLSSAVHLSTREVREASFIQSVKQAFSLDCIGFKAFSMPWQLAGERAVPFVRSCTLREGHPYI